MSKQDGVKKFKTLFIKVHLLAITWSMITGIITGIIPAIATYLLLIHLIPLTIYILDLESLKFNEINRKIFKATTTDVDIFKTMKENRNTGKGL